MTYKDIYNEAKRYYENKRMQAIFCDLVGKKVDFALAVMAVCEKPPKDINKAIRYYSKYANGFGKDKYHALKFVKKLMEAEYAKQCLPQ